MDLLTLHSTEQELKKQITNWAAQSNKIADELELEAAKQNVDEEKLLSLLKELNNLEKIGEELNKKVKEFENGVKFYD